MTAGEIEVDGCPVAYRHYPGGEPLIDRDDIPPQGDTLVLRPRGTAGLMAGPGPAAHEPASCATMTP